MPDQRKHRGPHPEDHQLFAESQLPSMQAATHDLSWLLTRGYATTSALKLVGDRYALMTRQRLAASRCACGDAALTTRTAKQVSVDDLGYEALWIDGYNVLTSLEAALSGGVILHARDGCYRDMASMHGSYRKVEETLPALHILGKLLAEWRVSECVWLLDRPVSNSGRLKTILREVAAEHDWPWQVELVPDPDKTLIDSQQIVASADSQVIELSSKWFNFARVAIDAEVKQPWIVSLNSEPSRSA